MTNYDFKPLNDKEFEALCVDLLSRHEGRRFARFKPGRDGGVDGRYFVDGREVVLQCKHWANTPVPALIRTFKNEEKRKLDELKPIRYIVAVSNPLSRMDKTKIFEALCPHLLCPDDIFGNEDLNDLLSNYPDLEQKHHKLWLHSANVLHTVLENAVLGRSYFKVQECIKSARRYVVTTNHHQALKRLKRSQVIILTGEPGIGKTTLAEQICLEHVAKGFELVEISDDIVDAESLFLVGKKQIFLFDDFLGQNYLDALSGHEGKSITRFIRRIVSDYDKRFVLTSRSTILNQGKLLISSLDHANIERTEYVLRIDALTKLERATILYNHMFHSDLSDEYREGICSSRRYKTIANNRNFNPRLIAYITDAERLDNIEPEDYWDFIKEILDNPASVWEHPFNAQLDDFSRCCVVLAALNGRGITEEELREGYYRFIAAPLNQSMRGTRDFHTNVKLLTGSFLKRIVIGSDPLQVRIALFNPSIGDFVLRRFAGDAGTIKLAMESLLTLNSFETAKLMATQGSIPTTLLVLIADFQLRHFEGIGFEATSGGYIARLALTIVTEQKPLGRQRTVISKACRYLVRENWKQPDHAITQILEWALSDAIVSSDEILEFSRNAIESISSSEDVRALMDLVLKVEPEVSGVDDAKSAIRDFIVDTYLSDIEYIVDPGEVFGELEYGQYEDAETRLIETVSNGIFEMGAGSLDIDENLVEEAVRDYGVNHRMDMYFDNQNYDDDRRERAAPGFPSDSSFDPVDDLFDRG